jgi:hypothetical protein
VAEEKMSIVALLFTKGRPDCRPGGNVRPDGESPNHGIAAGVSAYIIGFFIIKVIIWE